MRHLLEALRELYGPDHPQVKLMEATEKDRAERDAQFEARVQAERERYEKRRQEMEENFVRRRAEMFGRRR